MSWDSLLKWEEQKRGGREQCNYRKAVGRVLAGFSLSPSGRQEGTLHKQPRFYPTTRETLSDHWEAPGKFTANSFNLFSACVLPQDLGGSFKNSIAWLQDGKY